MSLNVTDSWVALPKAALYCGLGALISGAVFNKLSHLAEYTLNKTFGDYANLKKTYTNKIIVSMPPYKDFYYVQNIALSVVVAAIFTKVIHVLVLASSSRIKATPFLVGSVVAPVLFGLNNMILRHTGGHHGRWVEISGAEIEKRGINMNDLEYIVWKARVYSCFGASPKLFAGSLTESD